MKTKFGVELEVGGCITTTVLADDEKQAAQIAYDSAKEHGFVHHLDLAEGWEFSGNGIEVDRRVKLWQIEDNELSGAIVEERTLNKPSLGEHVTTDDHAEYYKDERMFSGTSHVSLVCPDSYMAGCIHRKMFAASGVVLEIDTNYPGGYTVLNTFVPDAEAVKVAECLGKIVKNCGMNMATKLPAQMKEVIHFRGLSFLAHAELLRQMLRQMDGSVASRITQVDHPDGKKCSSCACSHGKSI